MYKILLFDLDDTLLDFLKTEAAALSKSFLAFGLEPTPALISAYSEINRQEWEKLERRETTREALQVHRFYRLFQALGLPIEPEAFQETYQYRLGQEVFLVEGAIELLQRLQGRYRLFILSNGVAITQDSRLAMSGLVPYFENIFISERVGFVKPETAYYERCFAQIPDFHREEALAIGDSLSADILGGLGVGVDTCWFNYRSRPPRKDILPTYTINKLSELIYILE